MRATIFKLAQGQEFKDDVTQATFEVMEKNTTRQFKNKVLEQFIISARSINDFQLFYWTTVNDVDVMKEFLDDDEILIGTLKTQPWKKDFFFFFFFKKIYNPDEETTIHFYHDNDETVRSIRVHPKQSGATLFRQLMEQYPDQKFNRISISCKFFTKFKDTQIKNNNELLYKYTFFQPDIVLRLQAGEGSKAQVQELTRDQTIDDDSSHHAPPGDSKSKCCCCEIL